MSPQAQAIALTRSGGHLLVEAGFVRAPEGEVLLGGLAFVDPHRAGDAQGGLLVFGHDVGIFGVEWIAGNPPGRPVWGHHGREANSPGAVRVPFRGSIRAILPLEGRVLQQVVTLAGCGGDGRLYGFYVGDGGPERSERPGWGVRVRGRGREERRGWGGEGFSSC